MYFLIEDNDLLEKYDTIQDKFCADIKKEFGNHPIYHKIFSDSRIISDGDNVTDFQDKEIAKGDDQ